DERVAVPVTGDTTDLSNATIEELIISANAAYDQAQANLRDGNWTGYGNEMTRLQSFLAQLATITGIPEEPLPEEVVPEPADGDATGEGAPAATPEPGS
ncbi:MAG: hypothetical protein KDE19_11295, partial [Caldilineaceae bacterium]|nr:hypothetical protein [Caldilineaceae bacterium]